MATLTVFSNNDYYIYSNSTTYTTSRAGSGTKNPTQGMVVGQSYSGSTYLCFESFTQYDTSSLNGMLISAASEFLYFFSDNTTVDYTEEVRNYDWGGTLEASDYVAGANLTNYTLLSSRAVSPAAGYNEFSTSANFVAAINKTGYTRLIHNSSRHRAGNTPTGDEYVTWRHPSYNSGTTDDPKLVISYSLPILTGAVNITGSGNIAASGSAYIPLNFLSEPTANIRAPIATHVTVKSPTIYATSTILPEPTEATKIERIVNIDTGDATVCQAIAEELIGRWGRTQVSVSGVIPLDVRLKFKEKLHIKIPQAGIDEPLTLQRKQHDVFGGTTSIVCGDIILDDNELIARMLQDLINK